MGQITIPIYDGGATYAGIRQAKEQLGAAGAADRSAARQGARSTSSPPGARNSEFDRRGARRQGRRSQPAEVALAGVREEAKVGQRTTLDVLNAQQTLLSARVQLVTRAARPGRQFLHAAVGDRPAVDARRSASPSPEYDPRVHFDQVKNKLFGRAHAGRQVRRDASPAQFRRATRLCLASRGPSRSTFVSEHESSIAGRGGPMTRRSARRRKR